jgi:endoglucanase
MRNCTTRTRYFAGMLAVAGMAASVAQGSKLVDVRQVDDEHMMLHFVDTEVQYRDNGEGKGAFQGHESSGGERFFDYGKLNVAVAAKADSYTLSSLDDAEYSSGTLPTAVFRRGKVGGVVGKWPEPDQWGYEHVVYLRLPKKMQQGKQYTLKIAQETGTDQTEQTLKFDAFANPSEAVHVNMIGYRPDQPIKAADLYMWLGDGGSRDFAKYERNGVYLVNVDSGEKQQVGKVSFWKKNGPDVANWNFTRADVWNCDFSAFTGTGTYRMAVEGVGCSPAFRIAPDAYFEPFKTSVRGFYYMRIGEPKDAANPPPRQPRLIPGQDPKDLKVFLTTMSPWHPEWKTLPGDPWDAKDWSKWKEPGEPNNPNAWGGHSDALDWDRHVGHVSIIYDMLLSYLVSDGKIGEDNLGIRESGNGIPDVIDEAQNEVDFWLRLRDTRGGYAAGLNNPPENGHNTLYQAAARPIVAWANAANAAMLADALRIAGKPELVTKYRDAAVEAWKVANEQDLDLVLGVGNGAVRGRDLKMLAAACLYNVTGDRTYEDAMAKEAVANDPGAEIDLKEKHSQYWGTAAYLMCAKYDWQPIHHRELLAKMEASILRDAKLKNVDPSNQRPSRRGSDAAHGWFQTCQDMQAAIIAHAISTDAAEKDALLKAMLLEADWGLGRNPMNTVQMTGLGARHPMNIFTSGRNDGVPGVHPGHTPYMNANTWSRGFMGDPQWYAKKGYPTWDKWPQGEALWESRYCYSNSEFTPQQTMRGKMALLGYLYSLGETPRVK